MSASNDVITGRWTDYSRSGGQQLLESDFWAQWLKTLVAAFLALSGAYVSEIVKSFFFWFKSWWDQTSKHPERQPLLSNIHMPDQNNNSQLQGEVTTQGGSTQPGRETDQNGDAHRNDDSQNPAQESPLDIVKRSKGGRETTVNFIKDSLQRGADFSGAHAFAMVSILTVLFALSVALIIAGVFSARVATDRAALLSSAHCGIWEFDDYAGDDAAARADLHEHQKEARAGQYARNCYGSQNATDSTRCDFFYQTKIDFTTASMDKCPFKSYELCLGGLYSAVTFDTGLVDASNLGINAEVTHKFRRKTTCSPLNMDYPYVRNETFRDPKNTTYHYYYGGRFDDTTVPPTEVNYTYQTSGYPFDWLAPVYSVYTDSTSLYPEFDYWQPIPSLNPPDNSTLAIIFVSSMHIYHLKPSYDPIFPATQPRYVDGFHDPYYYNSDPRARPLACVDTTELCSPDGTTCWPMTADLPDKVPNTPAYWLMKWSLRSSTTSESIKWRLGTALLAQEKISQSRSQPLSDDHWEAEAKQLFATSLARAQFDAWGIAVGENREQPGYIEVTPDEGKGRLCGMYKFNSIGYTNINLGAFIGLLFTPFAIFFLSLEAKTVKRLFLCCICRQKGKSVEDTTGKASWEPLVINVGLKYFVPFFFYLVRGVLAGASWIYKKYH
ncbi:hypothetical protein MMC30_008167 [Trapelia coarctata]|nr:hypothetical protein [Trapelia coarctata]